MKYNAFIKYISCFFLIFPCLYSNQVDKKYPQHIQSIIPPNTKIGIVGAFPKPFGIFYKNRVNYLSKDIKWLGLFSSVPKDKIHFDINQIIVNQIMLEVQKNCSSCQVTTLSSIEPTRNVTGYLIEGWWGAEANMIDIPKLKTLVSDKIDLVLVIAPAKYYVPALNKEGVGVEIIHNYKRPDNPKHHFTIVYTMFLKDMRQNKKILSLNKQVIQNNIVDIQGTPDIKKRNLNYTKNDIDNLENWIQQEVSLTIAKQALCFLNLQSLKCNKLFHKPKKPLYYMLPH